MFCLGFLKTSQLINCFGKNRVVLRITYKSTVILKRTFYNSGHEKDRMCVSRALAAGWLEERQKQLRFIHLLVAHD